MNQQLFNSYFLEVAQDVPFGFNLRGKRCRAAVSRLASSRLSSAERKTLGLAAFLS
jgi:hypothetical protein